MELTMVFGSDSDEKRILPGIIAATKVIPDLEVRIEYASADNTPEKVKKVLDGIKAGWIPVDDAGIKLAESMQDGIPIISGAGMSNVLTGVAKGYGRVQDLIIGVPVIDSATGGLSSLLSTSEKPPLNPVLTVGLDNTYAAAQIASRFMRGKYEQLVIADTTLAEDYPVVKETIKSIEKKVIEFRIPYCIKPVSEIGPDDLVITPFSHANMHSHGAYSMVLKTVDSCLRQGKGIQIGVREKENVSKWHDYKACLDDLETTGIVGIGRYENAAIVAAQLMRLESGLRIVNDMKYSTDPKNPGKKMKLESHPGLTVKEGLYQGGK